ncbi:MAG: diphthine--ammonia ligase [Firmicutes bacterium]|nr:diphthine--ammonia ligase [Bacillota bacterium]
MNINNKNFFCSWSGGKDSCLSLYYALKNGGIPKRLLTMLIENGQRSRSHGLSLDLLNKQAELLNIPLSTKAATWDDYESIFIAALKDMKVDGIEVGVYGDIDLEGHRSWVNKVSQQANILVYHPLWQKPRREVLTEFIAAGFKATVIAVNEKQLGKEFLGVVIDEPLLKEFEKIGIDPAGENGEYHTVVTGGPIFKSDINYTLQEQILQSGYWFQDISLTQ